MQKIPTLFLRDPDNPSQLTDQVHPDCTWVLAGEGVATRKWDGTCVMFDGDRWWARREVKVDKVPPPGFIHTGRDETTGKTMGWEPIEHSSFAKFHAEAAEGENWEAATYELCGPRINGNPEGLDHHTLLQHRDAPRMDVVPDLDAIRATVIALGRTGIEGLVWHHPDGRMAKLKGRDFQ